MTLNRLRMKTLAILFRNLMVTREDNHMVKET